MTSITTIYGIKTCDTVRKARRWLEQHGIEHRFHDFRVDGLDAKRLQGWCKELGWESVLNRRGRSFRALAPELTAQLDESRAQALMLEEPTLIKRPVLEHAGRSLIGFNEKAWQAFFADAQAAHE